MTLRTIILSLAVLAAAALATGSAQAARVPGIHVQPMDLAVVSISTLPADRPRARDKLIHRITVGNAGSGYAHDVQIFVPLVPAAGMTFDVLDARAVRPDGTLLRRCTFTLLAGPSATVTCTVGDLAAGASLQVRIVTQPRVAGELHVNAWAHGSGLERIRGNNFGRSLTIVV